MRRKTTTMKIGMPGSGLAVGAGLGAVAAYFLDPVRGRGRRTETADRLAGLVRRAGRRAGRGYRYIRGTAGGLRERLTNHRSEPDTWLNDETLAHKVESELFRDPTIPKGSMNINAEYGTVVLRGTAESADEIDRIMVATMAIDGVLAVRNLMRTPSDAPTA
jgi:hypothetical protein